MARKELEDPVETGKLSIMAVEDNREFDTLDIAKIKVEVLPEEAARATRPFDGYPLKKVKMAVKETDKRTGRLAMKEKEFILTYFVLHNHIGDPVRQDASNRKVKTAEGMEQVKTYHGRSIPDVLGGGNANISIQFSTPIVTASGTFYGHYVPDHYVRSQLIFKYNGKTQKTEVDKRYMLLDREQVGRLKQCYLQIINPKIKVEKAADYISGASSNEPESMPEKDFGAE